MQEEEMGQAVSVDVRTFHVLFITGLLVFLFVLLVPVAKLLRRTGHNPAWCLFAIFPGLNFIALWFFAYKPWPSVDKSS
jgi:hypothetical protein